MVISQNVKQFSRHAKILLIIYYVIHKESFTVKNILTTIIHNYNITQISHIILDLANNKLRKERKRLFYINKFPVILSFILYILIQLHGLILIFFLQHSISDVLKGCIIFELPKLSILQQLSA